MQKYGLVEVEPAHMAAGGRSSHMSSLITADIPDAGFLPPLLFDHEDLLNNLNDAKVLDQGYLINKINYLHFVEKRVIVRLRHLRHSASILAHAYPEPCSGQEIRCTWEEKTVSGIQLKDYALSHLLVEDGGSVVVIPVDRYSLKKGHFVVTLPHEGYSVGARRTRRYASEGIAVEVNQHGCVAQGNLSDFSPEGFKSSVKPFLSPSLHWLNADEPVTVHLKDPERIYFSGECRCIRWSGDNLERQVVLAPAQHTVKRFSSSQSRNPRQQLTPPPVVSFVHPFLQKRVQLTVSDISTAGFCVYERPDESILLHGMVISSVRLEFSRTAVVNCTAQVVYRIEEPEKGTRCGFAILDMETEDYSLLSHILSNALDPHCHVSAHVDLDALWEFFFQSGFIYPSKYRLVQLDRDGFKRTYQKLYQENPEIAKHFTYQENGKIHGHISMVRAFERAWMIHHHASVAVHSRRAGFMVLKQLMHDLNDMHRLPSSKMDYVLCYYRPENKFPAKVFGGFAEELKDVRGCSVDRFCYLPYTRLSICPKLPEEWSLRESSPVDIWELSRFYADQSGGLLLKAMNLRPGESCPETLEENFRSAGFTRSSISYSLLFHDRLMAVLLVNQSDLGFNLSELLNCIQIFVTDSDGLPWNVLSSAISNLLGVYRTKRVPILFFPSDYMKTQEVPFEKEYGAWVLNVAYGGSYMDYMKRKFRIRNS